jgi:hypothetical protein
MAFYDKDGTEITTKQWIDLIKKGDHVVKEETVVGVGGLKTVLRTVWTGIEHGAEGAKLQFHVISESEKAEYNKKFYTLDTQAKAVAKEAELKTDVEQDKPFPAAVGEVEP